MRLLCGCYAVAMRLLCGCYGVTKQSLQGSIKSFKTLKTFPSMQICYQHHHSQHCEGVQGPTNYERAMPLIRTTYAIVHSDNHDFVQCLKIDVEPRSHGVLSMSCMYYCVQVSVNSFCCSVQWMVSARLYRRFTCNK